MPTQEAGGGDCQCELGGKYIFKKFLRFGQPKLLGDTL